MAAPVQDNKTTTGQRVPGVHGYVTAPIYQPYEDGLWYHELHSHSHKLCAFYCAAGELEPEYNMYEYILIRQPLCHKAFLRTRFVVHALQQLSFKLGP